MKSLGYSRKKRSSQPFFHEICSCEVQLPAAFAFCQTQRYMLLRKPKLDVKMSFWVVSCCSSKQFLNETHTVSLTDIFFRRAGPKCHRRQTCGDNAGSEKSRVTSVGAWNEIPWVDDIVFLWKNMQNALQNALQNGAVEAFFLARFLYDFWKLPIRSRMVSWNWCCSGQARAWKGLSWMERTGNVHRQLVQKDLSCKVYGLPSREPTYPFPTHFCRLFSFSQGGTCDRSLKGMWWVENLRMEKPSLLMPSCPYFQCYQLKLWDVSVSSLCLAQDLLKGMNCRISLWYTVPETNIFAPENWWYSIFGCELLVSGRVSQKPTKSWYMWKKSGLTSRSGGLLIFNSSTAQLYGRGAGPKDALKLLAAESPVTLVPAPKCRGIWRYQMLHWY